MTRLPLGVKLAVIARSLLVQGSWNYRTMIGTGMAFALLPLLRHRYADPDEVDGALELHASAFNAHPYLATLALGSLARLEHDRTERPVVRRFRTAVGGPLGALGDRVVWATWLPMTALLGLVAFALGVPAAGAVALFVLSYNAGHLGLRWWGFYAGLAEGTQVAVRLRTSGLARKARVADRLLVLLAGFLAGWLLAGRGPAEGLASASPAWALAGLGAVGIGVLAGARAWRPAAVVVVGLVALGLARGFFF